MRDRIRQEEAILKDIHEELEFNTKSQERALQRGRIAVSNSLDSVVHELRDEASRAGERCQRLKAELVNVEQACQTVFDSFHIAKHQIEGDLDFASLATDEQSCESPYL